MPKVSVIIRTKNEEKWIGRCLRAIFEQDFKDFEVIVVDNKSTDHTIAIARRYPVKKIVNLDEYRPGRALNLGVRASSGEFLACLSAHCIPRDAHWLKNLFKNLNEHSIAGAYGRQLPFPYSSDFDKRDLLITFGLDHRIQIKDSFFHNANSMVRRSVWEKIPFDEKTTNIEDRIWGKAVIEAGFRIAYEPEAAVYHHHGIHQNGNEHRASNVVRILESLDSINGFQALPSGFRPDAIHLLIVVPVFGPMLKIANRNLLKHCLEKLREASLVKEVAVIAQDQDAIKTGECFGVKTLWRPKALSAPSVTLENVLQHTLLSLEKGRADGYDAVLYVNYLYPFRPRGFFDQLIKKFCSTGVDTLVPTFKDYQPYWMESEEGKIVAGKSLFIPRQFKTPIQRGVVGLGCVSSAEFVRHGALIGHNVALMPIEEPLYALKASDPFARSVIGVALKKGERFFLANR